MAVSQPYGKLKDGRRVEQFLLRNKNGMEISCISYGCRLTHFLLPAGAGKASRGKKPADILLGYDTLPAYEEDALCHGALLGRYAGRIAQATFKIENRRYRIKKNDGEHFLHGSLSCALFVGTVVGDNHVRFTAVSPVGADGFPGRLWVSVSYRLTDENELVMDYRAETDEATYLNLSNHSCFNIAGQKSGSAMNGLLSIRAAGYLELGEDMSPTGQALPVAGGAFDFREEKPVGRDIVSRDPQLYLAKGYEHCFVLQKPRPHALALAATLRDAQSGRSLAVYTTQPGLVLYTCNRITGTEPPGKGGQAYMRRAGVCLAPMHFPNSPNCREFPSTLLLPGQSYHETTVLAAGWKPE